MTSRIAAGRRSALVLLLGAAALLTVATGLVLVFFSWVLLRSKDTRPLAFVAWALVVAGGVGNLIDRIAAGYVIDFMNLGIGSLRTGIFNVADVAISVPDLDACMRLPQLRRSFAMTTFYAVTGLAVGWQ